MPSQRPASTPPAAPSGPADARGAPRLAGRWLGAHRGGLAWLFVGVLAPLYLFGELAERIRDATVIPFDEPILLLMQRQATPWLDRAMLFASQAGSGPWVASFDVLVAVVLLLRRRWPWALYWALATGGAALLNQLAKHTYARARPDLWPPLAPETSFSFPSGHAMQSMALATALLVLAWNTRWRWPVLLAGAAFTGIVGLSRVYLGVHFPSDVLAGWCASLAWAVGLALLFRRRGRVGRHAAPPT